MQFPFPLIQTMMAALVTHYITQLKGMLTNECFYPQTKVRKVCHKATMVSGWVSKQLYHIGMTTNSAQEGNDIATKES